MKASRKVWMAALIALLVAPLSAPPDAFADDSNEKEAMMRVITRWNDDCSGSGRDRWDDMVDHWYDEITDSASRPWGHGSAHWSRSGRQVNGNIVDSDFVDPDNQAWGNDLNVIDAADAFMVGLHGGNDSGDHRWRASVRVDEPGTGNCGAYQGHMEFGDTDLEFLHLSSCHSMDREDWWNEWNSSFDGLHQIDGFHGNMYISYWYRGRYREFADDAYDISIADSWIDHMYVRHASGSNDQCPVARNVGSNSGDSLDRINHERYNNVYSDPPGLGHSRNHRVRYVTGCDPAGGEALP